MTKEEVKEAVIAGVNAAVGDLFIDRETHFKHHEALGEFIEFFRKTKSFTYFTLLGMLVVGMAGFLIAGFVLWIKKS